MSRVCAERWNRRRRPIMLQEALGPNVVGRCSCLDPNNSQGVDRCECRETCPEISEEIGVGKGFRLLPVNFLEFL